MRIALLSTCAVSVPPVAYGGTELVIAELAKMLTRRGHAVTVFATGDSRPHGDLRWLFPAPVWPPDTLAELGHAAHAWKTIAAARPPFDVVHLHQAPSVAFSALQRLPTVLTMHHERQDKLIEYYSAFKNVSYVAISRRQAELVPELAVRHVVHHGLDVDVYGAGDGSGGWLAFVGRFAAEKGVHVAIDVALACGLPLRMGGLPHGRDEPYFDREVRPRLGRAGDLVSWIGEVGPARKIQLLRGARATLFPIQWDEPFGLVMIESMLVGTPVIALARGSATEIVEDGVTGFVVRDAAEMANRVGAIGGIDRARCRRRARERWGALRMARDYERVYDDAVRAGKGIASPESDVVRRLTAAR
jgi:glycosyltransferase involved in cell wall biosynthesis